MSIMFYMVRVRADVLELRLIVMYVQTRRIFCRLLEEWLLAR